MNFDGSIRDESIQYFKTSSGRNIIEKVTIFFILFLMLDFSKFISISDSVIFMAFGVSLIEPFTGEVPDSCSHFKA